MKYIRTKNGRIIDCVKLMNKAKKHTLQNEDDYKLAHVLASKTYGTDLGWRRRVIKQADAIEELCDEFVININSKPHLIPKEWLVTDLIVDELYGAIWTDKGLIYVAKMNDKGELELICG